MATSENVPYVSQSVQEVQTLLQGLSGNFKDSQAKKKGFSCKHQTFLVNGSPAGIKVDSWRFQDWDYKRDDLPTYARGLFTTKNEKNQPEVAIRGYDKFFNTDEVPTTKWENILAYTQGPYELSLKENGCIIFISGLHDGSLLVCSKHSTGPRNDAEQSHAMAGEAWVDRQLQKLGRTREDLAKELRKRNITAVAELCDDDFEEHILAYGKEDAGLYLHGINLNLPEFMTYPGDQVQAFAEEWGFKKTDFLVIQDIHETRSFLEGVADTGSYNGRDIEGFVIRCKARFTKGPAVDWFFKYKFEEPYLMYRQWRECTKALIAGRPPRYKKHVKITEDYLLYARRRLAESTKLAKQYNQNHGIIALRDDFLKEINMKGSDIIRQEFAAMGGAPEDVTKDIILVPIATIGCGKTTIALALVHLFGWGHIQNDNITGKNRPPRFTAALLEQLDDKPVAIADRNNAQRHERKQIIEDVHKSHPQVRLVALNFVHSRETLNRVRAVTQDRVFARGDNHQTIQAASDKKKVLGIMEGFINRYENLNPEQQPDDGFDSVIDLDPTADSRQNLETVISQLSSTYPKLISELPTSDDLDEAMKFALSDYKPDLRHDVSYGGSKPKNQKPHQQKQQPITLPKKKPLEYMSVTLPTRDILEALEMAFGSISSNKARFFRHLQETRRIQVEFHVTLIHRASAKAHPELWEKYSAIHVAAGGAQNKLGDCPVVLERVVWDDRIMAIVARLTDENWECVNEIAHITVGTIGPDVKPKESNDLLKRWLAEGSGDNSGIGEVAFEGRQTIPGTVQGVLSR
ncbi:tRNA ligase [Coleophoma cylindrospora]|uniref:tRNA ligase n=1 Tax=Coleophoma cylindrospora TaxID=1849047 RepID=A0A3D8QWU6_9HELO|nr:tRNA ligase [Coleophoma cylindrospora]